MRQRLAHFLASPRAALLICAFGVLLCSPALSTGLTADDYFHKLVLRGSPSAADAIDEKAIPRRLSQLFVWADGGDAGKAFDAVNASDQSIHLLREALKADPAAMKLLAQNHIAVDQVIDIAPTGNGAVQLYIS